MSGLPSKRKKKKKKSKKKKEKKGDEKIPRASDYLGSPSREVIPLVGSRPSR